MLNRTFEWQVKTTILILTIINVSLTVIGIDL